MTVTPLTVAVVEYVTESSEAGVHPNTAAVSTEFSITSKQASAVLSRLVKQGKLLRNTQGGFTVPVEDKPSVAEAIAESISNRVAARVAEKAKIDLGPASQDTTVVKWHGKVRETGTLVSILDAGKGAEGGRWWTLCEEHGHQAPQSNSSKAWTDAAHPRLWCPNCAS